MNTNKPLHIFRAGNQTDSSGASIEFSEADLAATANAYDPALYEAPIVVGHPKSSDAPAYGWIQSLKNHQDDLEATAHQVDPEFAELVKAGRFKKISSSFYSPNSPNNPVPGVYYLRHVGFLGAQPPAVKGLRDVSFNDSDEGVVEFSDWGMQTNASLWRNMRDWILAKFGQEDADRVIPDWQIESIKDAAREETHEIADTSPSFTEANKNDNVTAGTSSPASLQKEENHVNEQEKAALEAENARLKQQLAAVEAEKKAADAAARNKVHADFAESLIAEGKLKPADKDTIVAVLDFAEAEDVLEFGEGDKRQPLASALKTFLLGMPKVIEFREMAVKDRAATHGASVDFAECVTEPERLSLHTRAKALVAEKGMTYEQAIRQLI